MCTPNIHPSFGPSIHPSLRRKTASSGRLGSWMTYIKHQQIASIFFLYIYIYMNICFCIQIYMISLSLSFSLYVYIYIYIHMHANACDPWMANGIWFTSCKDVKPTSGWSFLVIQGHHRSDFEASYPWNDNIGHVFPSHVTDV